MEVARQDGTARLRPRDHDGRPVADFRPAWWAATRATASTRTLPVVDPELDDEPRSAGPNHNGPEPAAGAGDELSRRVEQRGDAGVRPAAKMCQFSTCGGVSRAAISTNC